MEPSNDQATPPNRLSRRTIMKGAAWSVPVIAAAVAVPAAAASTPNTIVITPSTAPAPTGTCTTVSDFTFTVTQHGGAAVPGQAIIVTLPTGFSWQDGTTGAKTFTTDGSGKVVITGVTASSVPGSYSVLAMVTPNGATTSVTVTVTGVWIGAKVGYGGTGIYQIFTNGIADPNNPGTPDNWAYCIEHNVSARTGTAGQTGGLSSYLGSNYFTDPAIQAKVLWILANSYPALSLAAFGAAAGAPNISANDAIEGTQYAIWRFTDLNYDTNWQWADADSQTAYEYLVAGAKAVSGSGGTGTIVSVPQTTCGTPTSGTHAQSIALVSAL
jgi:TQXA domain-containing protein